MPVCPLVQASDRCGCLGGVRYTGVFFRVASVATAVLFPLTTTAILDNLLPKLD